VNTVEENLFHRRDAGAGDPDRLPRRLAQRGDRRLVIPLALLGAFILMDLWHVSANLISLGAVDFGLIVDAAVVMVEAFLVRLALSPPPTEEQLRDRHATLVASEPSHEAAADTVHMELTGEHAPDTDRAYQFAMRAEVGRREVFARVAERWTADRVLEGDRDHRVPADLHFSTRGEAHLSPMAFTLSFALAGSLLLCITLVPVLASM